MRRSGQRRPLQMFLQPCWPVFHRLVRRIRGRSRSAVIVFLYGGSIRQGELADALLFMGHGPSSLAQSLGELPIDIMTTPDGKSTRMEIGKLASLVLLTIVVLTGALFLSRAYHRSEEAASRYWFNQAEASVRGGDPALAVREFRTALVTSHNNPQYQLRLAQALFDTGRLIEAQSYLMVLWHDQPGNGVVNLYLARIAALRGDSGAAVRFFHGAVYGVWDGDAVEKRTEVRFELAEYLLRLGRLPQANSELLTLQSELPERSLEHKRAALLFAKTHDLQRSFREYETAARVAPNDQDVLIGAGEAALELGRYQVARGYFTRAQAQGSAPAAADALKQIATIESVDPFAREVRYSVRVSRALTLFRLAGERIQTCMATAADAAGDRALTDAANAWEQLYPQVTESKLRKDPDLLDKAVDAALSVEQAATTSGCSGLRPEDRAIAVIARQRSTRP